MVDQSTLRHIPLRTDFHGLIRILARNLYSEQDVFVRELLQNGYDAIAVRSAEEPAHAGRLDLNQA